MLKVTFLASGQFFDRSMFRLINTTYSWIQVILRQISLYRAFHGIAHSYWTRTTYNGHRTGSLIAEDLLNPEVPGIQNSFAEAFLRERICCNVISPERLAITANSASKRGSILTSYCLSCFSAASISGKTSD